MLIFLWRNGKEDLLFVDGGCWNFVFFLMQVDIKLHIAVLNQLTLLIQGDLII